MLTFNELRAANLQRCNSGVFNHLLGDWTPERWQTALSGEVGELGNLIKKGFRQLPTDPSGDELKAKIASEMADVAVYLDLFAARMGIDLAQAIQRKFNETSRRVGSRVMLEPWPQS